MIPFGTGTFFPIDGNTPVEMERMKNSVREGVMLTAAHLSIFAEIPSCPVDFDVSSAAKRSKTE